MSEAEELLNLIHQAGENEIRLNHVAAELHQDNVQRTVAQIITLNDSVNSSAEAALVALVGNGSSSGVSQ